MTTTVSRTGRPSAGVGLAYNVGAGNPPGVWLGLDAPTLGVLGGGLVSSVGAAAVGLPLGWAALPVLFTAALVLVRVAGRSLLAWLPPTVGQARLRLVGQCTWSPPPAVTVLCSHRPLPTPASRTRASGAPGGTGVVRLRLPAEYGRPRLLVPHPAQQGCGSDMALPGWVLDASAGTATVVFAVAGVDRFPLLDSAEQDRLLAGWGSALTLLSRDPAVLRVQLVDRQGNNDQPRPEEPAPAAPQPAGDGGARRCGDLVGLQAQLRALTVARDSLLAVQFRLDALTVGGSRGRRDRRNNRDGLARSGAARAQHLATGLLGAQLVSRPLTGSEVAEALTAMLTSPSALPGAGAPTFDSAVSGGAGACGGVVCPTAANRRLAWDHVRVEDSWHRSYAVTGWPRTPGSAGWLSPLLLAAPAGAARTLAVHLEPVGPAHAARLARSARTRAELDVADRQRLGLAGSAAADLTVEGAADLDAELVAGHSAHRLTALITCTAADLDALAVACGQLKEAAGAARLQVRPLHGQHHLALAATVPLCRVRSGGLA